MTAAGRVGNDAAATAGNRLTADLRAENGVAAADSYWTLNRPSVLRNRTGIARPSPGGELAVDRIVTRLMQTYRDRDYGPPTLQLGGAAVSYHEATEQLGE